MSDPNSPTPLIPKTTLRKAAVIPKTKLKLNAVNSSGAATRLGKIKPVNKQDAAAAKAKAAEEAKSAAAAEAEAMRLAQKDYEEQMEQYNRQMEEYNRQVAEEEAAKAAEAEAAAKAAAELQAEEQAAAAKAEEQAAAAKAEEEAKAAKAAEAIVTAADVPAAPSIPDVPARNLAGIDDEAPVDPTVPATTVRRPGAATAGASLPASNVGLAPAKAAGIKRAPVKKIGLGLKPPADTAPAAATDQDQDQDQDQDDSELSPGELRARDAEIRRLQAELSEKPLWKKPIFIGGLTAIILAAALTSNHIISTNAAKAKARQEVEYTNKLLIQAQEINQKGAENLAEVKEKGIKLKCSLKDARMLMGVVIDPYQLNEQGKKRFGPNANGVAQNACLLLGIMAESDPKIEKMVFSQLKKNAPKISPMLFTWQVQRLAVADIPNINDKLSKLVDEVSKRKSFKNQDELVASIWEAMGLRVSEKELPLILEQLQQKEIDRKLLLTFAICLDNIIDMSEDADKKSKIADQIFESVQGKNRLPLLSTMAKGCSEKALAHYQPRMQDSENWNKELIFVANWGDDKLIPELLDMRRTLPDNDPSMRTMRSALATAFAQNRERDVKLAKSILPYIYDAINEDSSDWQAVINKVDPDAGDYVGDDSAELPKLKERRKVLEKSRQQKLSLIRSLSSLHDFKWVASLLGEYAKDADEDIRLAAEKGLESIQANGVRFAAQLSDYKRRTAE